MPGPLVKSAENPGKEPVSGLMDSEPGMGGRQKTHFLVLGTLMCLVHWLPVDGLENGGTAAVNAAPTRLYFLA